MVICDRRGTHHEHELDVVSAEAERCRVAYAHPEFRLFGRLSAEYSIADRIILGSNYARDTFLNRGFTADVLETINYGVDTTLFSPANSEKPTNPTARLLFVGHLDARKGVRLLAEALPHVGFPYLLLLAGSQEPYAIEMLERSGVAYQVLGRMSRVALADVYREADIFVLPSVADAYPLVTLEAMASGCIVVVSDGCGTADLIDDGLNGFGFVSGDIGGFVSCLERAAQLLGEPGVTLRERAREVAVNQSWAEYGRRLLSFYTPLLP